MFNDDHWCFQIVPKVFQGRFKKTFKVFQKSFMLHGTHHSFPSRRRACFRRGRCEISVISHRPLYCKNMLLKFVSRHFILILHSPVAIILLIILLTGSANSGANSLIIVFGKIIRHPRTWFLSCHNPPVSVILCNHCWRVNTLQLRLYTGW